MNTFVIAVDFILSRSCSFIAAFEKAMAQENRPFLLPTWQISRPCINWSESAPGEQPS